MKKITPHELYEKMTKEEEMILLDVRAEEKYKDFHIEVQRGESLNIPKTHILENYNDVSLASLPKQREIIVTCTTGNSATKCANILSEKAFDVFFLEGGITAWKDYLEKNHL